MTEPVSAIRNLGPATEAIFLRAGITSAEQLREIGAEDAYRRVLESGTRPHFIGFYALVMGLQGRPWSDCRGAEKEALRLKFDQLAASTKKKDRPDIEAILDNFGVRRVP